MLDGNGVLMRDEVVKTSVDDVNILITFHALMLVAGVINGLRPLYYV